MKPLHKYLIIGLLLLLCIGTVSAEVLITNFTTGSYVGEKFTGAGTISFVLNAPAGTSVEYLIIGGGAGGGYSRGAGGGAGGFRNGTFTLTSSTVTIAVGKGGTAGIAANESGRGGQGANSTFAGIVSDGGGWGGTAASGNPIGGHGASGGGSVDGFAVGTGTSGQGLAGGIGSTLANYGAGGGGGNQTVGTAGSGTNGGAGGNGGQSAITGTMTYYSGGGGGGIYSAGVPGSGGSGGGGAGGLAGAGTAGTDGLGGAGGGGGYVGSPFNGGRGGNGTVIVRWIGGDTTPPDSITGLTDTKINCTAIKWDWTNPTNSDFNHTYVLKNNVFIANYTNTTTTSTWDSLTASTAYTFSSKTVDLTGNINATWVNRTETTDACPTPTPTPTPTPLAIPVFGDVYGFLSACDGITWILSIPADVAYNGTMVYQNNTYLYNVTNTSASDFWIGLDEGISYTISTKAIYLNGTVNTTWKNATSQTALCGCSLCSGFPVTTVTTLSDLAIPYFPAKTNEFWLKDLVMKNAWWLILLIGAIAVLWRK